MTGRGLSQLMITPRGQSFEDGRRHREIAAGDRLYLQKRGERRNDGREQRVKGRLEGMGEGRGAGQWEIMTETLTLGNGKDSNSKGKGKRGTYWEENIYWIGRI